MASIVLQIVVVLVNRELSEGSVNWPHVSRRNRQNSYRSGTVNSKSFVGKVLL